MIILGYTSWLLYLLDDPLSAVDVKARSWPHRHCCADAFGCAFGCDTDTFVEDGDPLSAVDVEARTRDMIMLMIIRIIIIIILYR